MNKEYLIDSRDHPAGDGTQMIFRFPNGYGASIVRFKIPSFLTSTRIMYGSYTDNEEEWELAVIKFNGDGIYDFEVTHDTPITNDVLGHLSDEEVNKVLEKIKELE